MGLSYLTDGSRLTMRRLECTDDILSGGKKKQFLTGFAEETDNVLESTREKLLFF